VLRADDLVFQRLRASQVRGEVARTMDQAIGQAVRRTILPGQPLALADLSRPLAVAKGARVSMQLVAPGLQLSAQGQALEAGAIGDRIQVLNPASRAVVEAEITGRDRVRVAPGSAPILPAGSPNFGNAQVALR
jgi:flagella basal body P-ring formation protein FlgA